MEGPLWDRLTRDARKLGASHVEPVGNWYMAAFTGDEPESKARTLRDTLAIRGMTSFVDKLSDRTGQLVGWATYWR